MAITKTIQIHDSQGITNAAEYIEDEDKTTLNDDIAKVLEYDVNDEKTTMGNGTVLVDGYECDPADAEEDFYYPRYRYQQHHNQNFQTKKPVVAIHMIQSFPSMEDLDPRLVHQAGMELVQGLKAKGLGDYQAVVSTHMNTQHLHNHILLNAYSIDGTRKFHDNMSTLNVIRELNDEISRKYGLPILNEVDKTQTKSEKIGERYVRDAGLSWKEQMRQDFDACLNTAENYTEWKEQVNAIGYTFREMSDGTPISVSDGTHNVRMSKLGSKYTYEGIIEQLAAMNDIDISQLKHQHEHLDPKVYLKKVSRFAEDGHRRSDLEIILLSMIQYIRLMLEQIKMSKKMVQDQEKELVRLNEDLQTLNRCMEMMQHYGIEKISDIRSKKKEVGHKTSTIQKALDQLVKMKTDLLAGTKQTLAEASPMTSMQRQELFILSKDTGYHVRAGFDQIASSEAERALRFLRKKKLEAKDKWKGTDLQAADLPDIFKPDFKPTPLTQENALRELKFVDAYRTHLESRLENNNKVYKDLVYLDKGTRNARDEYSETRERDKSYSSDQDR